jgi:hypothetical protein
MIWTWVSTNSGVICIILAAIPIIWGAISYINIKKREANYLQFKTYHELIRQLVEPEKPNSKMFLDRQVAIIYELRFYKKYYPVSLRMLKGLKVSWTKPGVLPRLLQELDITINFLENKGHDRPNFISRWQRQRHSLNSTFGRNIQ